MNRPTLHLICNAHLDPVWQWRWEEGCAEALATFRTAVTLLREHPELVFNHNEAVLYQWVLEHDPHLFREIQAMVGAGRWCISGGWFLQPDVNLPDTESLIRHMAVGRRFFRQHFGVEPRVAYNFDSFGHSGGLPQLLVQGGYAMYIHQRPQEPDLVLPSDLYRWRGVDGSEILTLRIVVGLYHTERDNLLARLEAGVVRALRLGRDVPVFWGLGNHGGGPTRQDLQTIDAFTRRETRVTIRHSTPEHLYESLAGASKAAPAVEGDLQRVFTGCYTSLARVKRRAVKSLAGLVQTEALRAAAWWQSDCPYPEALLDEAWRDHLFNDFHDILPGSCVEPAERDALDLYGKASETSRRLRLGAATAFNAGPPRNLYLPVTILNANPACRRAPVEVEAMLDLRPKWSGQWHLELFTSDGAAVECQEEQPEALLPFNGWRRKVVFFANLPAVGARHYQLEIREGAPQSAPEPPSLAHCLDSQTGLITRLDAGGGRECVSAPWPKALVVEDSGDSWGTDCSSYRNVVGQFAPIADSVRVLAAGPIRTVTESQHWFGSSRLVLQTVAYAGWPAIEFRLRIHWQEERRRLKLALPTTFSCAEVRCEVPGGVIRRPADGQEHVHRRWLMLEDLKCGQPTALGIAHDGFHGFDFQDGEIRFSVLRSAGYCHEQGLPLDRFPARKFMDQGVHEVRMILTAGEADVVRTSVVGLADWLSAAPATYAHLPIGSFEADGAGAGEPAEGSRPQAEADWPVSRASDVTKGGSLLSLSPANVRLLACKRSWDGEALIVRLQEIAGGPARARFECEGLAGPRVLSLRAYEIKTLRIERNGTVREVSLIGET